jgi:hypothetical protein
MPVPSKSETLRVASHSAGAGDGGDLSVEFHDWPTGSPALCNDFREGLSRRTIEGQYATRHQTENALGCVFESEFALAVGKDAHAEQDLGLSYRCREKLIRPFAAHPLSYGRRGQWPHYF